MSRGFCQIERRGLRLVFSYDKELFVSEWKTAPIVIDCENTASITPFVSVVQFKLALQWEG